MQHKQPLINALPLVADVLGRKYGVKVHIGGKRAYTDGKNIHIPALPLVADEQTLNLARGYLDHEAAHLRLTDFKALADATISGAEKHIWNMLEDFMVERRLSGIYPGCAQNFQWLARHVFLSPEPESIASPASAIFDWLLMGVRAFDVPELGERKRQLEPPIKEAFPGLLQELEPMLRSVPRKCQDTRSCLKMACEIIGIIEAYVEKARLLKTQGKQGDSQQNKGKNGRKQGEQSGNAETRSMEDSGNSVSGSTSDAKNRPIAQSQKDQELGGSTEDRPEDSSGYGNSPLSESAILAEILKDASKLKASDMGTLAGHLLEAESEVNDNNQLEIATIQPVRSSNLSMQDIAEIRSKTGALRTRMTALLQSKVLCRFAAGRHGRLDRRRIGRLAVSDPGIFARRNERQGISATVHILLDASASMLDRSKMKLAAHTCYAVTEALYKTPGITVAVTSFPNGILRDSERGTSTWATIAPILAPRQKLHVQFDIWPNGATPMAPALWWVLQQLRQQPENRKILLLLSDGEPDELEQTRNAITAHYACGHELYGIGIASTAINRLMESKRCRIIYELEELAAAMFGLLQPALLKRTGGCNENAH